MDHFKPGGQVRIWVLLVIVWSFIKGPDVLDAYTVYQGAVESARYSGQVKQSTARTSFQRNLENSANRAMAQLTRDFVPVAESLFKIQIRIYLIGIAVLSALALIASWAFAGYFRREDFDDYFDHDDIPDRKERKEPTLRKPKEGPKIWKL